MADINSFSFTGRLGQDAQVNTTPNGKTVLELSCANNIGFGDYKKTQWLKVRMWGERANSIKDIFKKGALIGGVGELSTDAWTSQTGETKTTLVVTCMNIQLLAGPKQAAESPSGSNKEMVY